MELSILAAPAQLSIRASEKNVRLASNWIEQTCHDWNVPANELGRLDICLCEIMANILMHSGLTPESLPIELSFSAHHSSGANKATVTVSDAGRPFDPLIAPEKSLPLSLADAEPGGLGLVMIRSNSDELEYHYLNGRNQFSFAVTWTGDSR